MFSGCICVAESRRCMHTTYQILLLQGFSMYKSMFSINIAEVLCMKQITDQ